MYDKATSLWSSVNIDAVAADALAPYYMCYLNVLKL